MTGHAEAMQTYIRKHKCTKPVVSLLSSHGMRATGHIVGGMVGALTLMIDGTLPFHRPAMPSVWNMCMRLAPSDWRANVPCTRAPYLR